MKKAAIVFWICIYLAQLGESGAQAPDMISQLLDDISKMQVSAAGDKDFFYGMFPSYRQCGGAPHRYRPDNNIFFTAVAAFALQQIQPELDAKGKQLIDNILSKARSAYPYYRNQYGLPYYGFWPTNGSIMPHTLLFQYLKPVFGQGEDADDSVMILMTDSGTEKDKLQLRSRMEQLANGAPGRQITSVDKKYRAEQAYSTYLGDRMPVDFDFGVHCNLLYFTMQNGWKLNTQDSATIRLISAMVRERDYLSNPIFISPYYVKSPILIYHIARLMGTFKVPQLEPYRQQLISDARALIPICHNIMDKIILCTSLLRLGADAPVIEINNISDFETSNQQQFVFFQARAAFSYPPVFKRIFLHWSYIYYYFYCPAYNKILFLEYLVNSQLKTDTKNLR
jgi:hypothetical protein